MFEVRAYVGPYRKGGFLSLKEATDHADKLTSEEGQPHIVYELTMKHMSTVNHAKAKKS